MRTRTCILGLVALALACDHAPSPTSDPESDEYIPPFPPIEEVTPPPVCTNRTSEGVVVALPWRSNIDTFLPLARDVEWLSLDYHVRPRAFVSHVSIEYEFDRATPVDAWSMDRDCPDVIDFAPVVAPLAEVDNVIRLGITADSDDAGGARHGRVFFAHGAGTIELRLDGVDAGASGAPWWFVFQPIGGEMRLVLAPVSLTRTTASFTGLPDVPAVVALMQTREVDQDSATGALYASRDFVNSWRTNADAWYATTIEELPAPGQLLVLQSMRPAGAEVPVELIRDRHELGDSGDIILVTSGRSGSSTLSVPCAIPSFRVTRVGLGPVALTRGEHTFEIGTASPLEIPTLCDAGDARSEFTLAYGSYSWKPLFLRITWPGAGR